MQYNYPASKLIQFMISWSNHGYIGSRIQENLTPAQKNLNHLMVKGPFFYHSSLGIVNTVHDDKGVGVYFLNLGI